MGNARQRHEHIKDATDFFDAMVVKIVDKLRVDKNQDTALIERNWGLKPLAHRSRDNLHNPIMSTTSPYIPTNIPAIGDLFDMLDFKHEDEDRH